MECNDYLKQEITLLMSKSLGEFIMPRGIKSVCLLSLYMMWEKNVAKPKDL